MNYGIQHNLSIRRYLRQTIFLDADCFLAQIFIDKPIYIPYGLPKEQTNNLFNLEQKLHLIQMDDNPYKV